MERSQVKRLANGILLAGIAFSVGAVVLLQNGGHIRGGVNMDISFILLFFVGILIMSLAWAITKQWKFAVVAMILYYGAFLFKPLLGG